ncbi:MAG: hypothetical protein ABI867_18255 [Kofleriaceae bacterium]
MNRLKLLLASALLATSVAACAPALAHTSRVDPVKVEISRAELRTKLAERRAATIKNFLAYRDARVYPVNLLPGGGFRHVWVDGNGNLCAAATLISKDWGRDATVRIGIPNVEIKMADATGDLANWILTSGLTRAEIVAIQVPGWNGGRDVIPIDQFQLETERLYGIYFDVERQMKSLAEQNLDLAVDQLMKRPDLAREVLGGRVAGPGVYAKPPVG